MKPILLSVCLVVGLVGGAWADGDWSPDNIVKVCNGGQSCIDQLMAMRADRERARERAEERQLMREMSQQQALGMAAFGSGHALINGMNQGFQGMRLPPYHQPGASK